MFWHCTVSFTKDTAGKKMHCCCYQTHPLFSVSLLCCRYSAPLLNCGNPSHCNWAASFTQSLRTDSATTCAIWRKACALKIKCSGNSNYCYHCAMSRYSAAQQKAWREGWGVRLVLGLAGLPFTSSLRLTCYTVIEGRGTWPTSVPVGQIRAFAHMRDAGEEKALGLAHRTTGVDRSSMGEEWHEWRYHAVTSSGEKKKKQPNNLKQVFERTEFE